MKERLPCSFNVPHAGFGYPLCGLSCLNPWDPLSDPYALGLLPSKLCSFWGIEKTISISSLRSCTFLGNLTGLPPVLQRFLPPQKAVSLIAPHGLGEVRTSCSLGLMDLSGFLSNDACTKMSLLCAAPLVLMSLSSHENSDPEPQGVGPSSDRHLPSKRVPARMAFLTICVRYLFGRSARRGLFFPLG